MPVLGVIFLRHAANRFEAATRQIAEDQAQTLILDPIGGGAMIAAFPLPCLSWKESMAEKLRAALSRRETAIRDFYDIHHAVRRMGLNVLEPDLSSCFGRRSQCQVTA